ncbi:putative TonB-dependent receptor precursor [compost metagenome]
MRRLPLRLSPFTAALWLASPLSQAVELQPQVITANPLGNSELAAPTTVLEGDALALQQKGSLGQTLNNQPGVASTWFGPGASRPVIRGLDGDRIRILRNGVGALDASSLSYDHAVPLDPATVDRIEIVRGPAALLYGGNAIGGVVNSFDNRIPTDPVDGIHGAGELRYGGADTTMTCASPAMPAVPRSATPTSRAASIAWKTATAARMAVPSAVPIIGITATPACPTAATTRTMARWPSPACVWTCSRITTVSPPSCAISMAPSAH